MTHCNQWFSWGGVFFTHKLSTHQHSHVTLGLTEQLHSLGECIEQGSVWACHMTFNSEFFPHNNKTSFTHKFNEFTPILFTDNCLLLNWGLTWRSTRKDCMLQQKLQAKQKLHQNSILINDCVDQSLREAGIAFHWTNLLVFDKKCIQWRVFVCCNAWQSHIYLSACQTQAAYTNRR